MLVITATHYVSPLSEVDFASVPLTVHIVNVADETGLVTGTFRVYNDTTGLLIHTSDIAPLTLAAGAGADVSALTDFDPPAPADDVYFIIFDGNANNALVPDGINFSLGAFHFDVKPVGMGPAPAAHHATHEDGGSDEVDLTGMSGLLATPQTPTAHAASHGAGQADDISADYQIRAEKGAPGGYCSLPSPLNNTLPLRADGTPNFPSGAKWESDFLHNFSDQAYAPWDSVGTASGTLVTAAAPAGHPGILGFRSAAGANSGRVFRAIFDLLVLAGNELFTAVFRLDSLTDIIVRAGFIDLSTTAAIHDGAWIQIATVGGIPGTAVGMTSDNDAQSTTATSTVLVTGTWYTIKIAVNADASEVSFYISDDAGNLIWSDSLDTNIPVTPGRETGIVFQGWKTSITATTFLFIDYLAAEIRRDLHR